MTVAQMYYCPACGAFVVPVVCGYFGTCPQCAAETVLPWQENDVATIREDVAPKPTLDAVPVLDHGFVRLVGWLGDDETIAKAARASYGASVKTAADDVRLIRRLMKDKHTSPFEHVVFTFEVKAPVFITRMWQRHRTWSYSEQSQRYAEVADEFYLPTTQDIRGQSKTNKQVGDVALDADTAKMAASFLHDAYDWSARYYTALLSLGVSREQARMVLPLSVYSRFIGTVDLHNLFHFLRLRLAADAQYEIRVYAQAIAALIKPITPAAYAAFEESLRDG